MPRHKENREQSILFHDYLNIVVKSRQIGDGRGADFFYIEGMYYNIRV